MGDAVPFDLASLSSLDEHSQAYYFITPSERAEKTAILRSEHFTALARHMLSSPYCYEAGGKYFALGRSFNLPRTTSKRKDMTLRMGTTPAQKEKNRRVLHTRCQTFEQPSLACYYVGHDLTLSDALGALHCLCTKLGWLALLVSNR